MFRETDYYNKIQMAGGLKLPKKPSTTKRRLASDPESYSFASPDDIYNRGSCTFIFNRATGKLYIEMYPSTHDQMLRKNNYAVAKEVGLKPPAGRTWRPWRDDLIRAGIPNGRAGRLYGIPAIGFWTNKPMDKGEVQSIVRMLLGKIPSFKSDETIIVFSNESRGFTPFAIDPQNKVQPPPDISSMAKTQQPTSTDPICSDIAKVTVGGVDYDLGHILGDLHMVRGERLEGMKATICSNYDAIRSQLEKHGCKFQIDMLDSIKDRIHCSNSSNEYERLKSIGAANYRQDLRDLFAKGAAAGSDPNSTDDPVGTEFRGRQSDIDAAFDFLTRKESFAGFKQWLLKEEQHEKERRSGGFARPASHKRNWK